MIELLDTTLRDGEQTNGVSFSRHEKKEISRLLLDELNVNRIEIGSARVSKGEFDSIRKIAQWASQAGCLARVEVLGFIDGGESLQWIKSTGCQVMNLLCKGSQKHLAEQLRKTPAQHIDGIIREVEAAGQMGIAVNVYLEDWSNGIRQSPEYVYRLMEALAGLPLKRIMLPDTLGVLNPEATYACCSDMVARYPEIHFDFHAHNDYDLA
ncbi:MAG: 2-isopropylmalate synthase, partial [Tannerella sp.]|nr:2-isopropylmalate synthase [Tannerella sp.]